MNEIRHENRDRLDELLANTPQQSDSTHLRNMREANVRALVDLRDAIETGLSVGFGIPGAIVELDGEAGYSEDELFTALAAHGIDGNALDTEAFLATLRDMADNRPKLVPFEGLSAEGARVTDAVRGVGSVYPMTDDPRIDDSIVYGNTGAEPSTHLPVEHMPATDAEPSTDFDEVIGSWSSAPEAEADPGDAETYEEPEPERGEELVIPEDVKPFSRSFAEDEALSQGMSSEQMYGEKKTTPEDSDIDPDLADFKGESGQAPEKPVSGFEKIKKNKKKGKGKE